MGLHLRRRRKLESVPTGAVPPADGNAPCLDAYSRRWGTQPIAGRFVDWAAATHYAGFGEAFCGVWHGDDPLTPVRGWGYPHPQDTGFPHRKRRFGSSAWIASTRTTR